MNGASDLFSEGAGDVDLYGYFNCLASGITEGEAVLGDAYLPPSNDVTSESRSATKVPFCSLPSTLTSRPSPLVPRFSRAASLPSPLP